MDGITEGVEIIIIVKILKGIFKWSWNEKQKYPQSPPQRSKPLNLKPYSLLPPPPVPPPLPLNNPSN